ncbi:MAG: dihydrofolate reductase family protein [Anaerolineae bacterium]
MLPKVIVHTEVSVDGRMDWLRDDEFLYYRLIGDWGIDAMLSGSGTMLAAYPNPDSAAELAAPKPEKPAGLQRLVIVDSRAQLRCWRQMQQSEWWGEVTALVAEATPKAYVEELTALGIDVIVAGEERVDLRAALEALNARYGTKVVRVDSGGLLIGALLRAGLVDELSVILSPTLVGGTSPRSFYVAPDLPSAEGAIPLRLTATEAVDDNFVWLRYAIDKPAENL